MHWIRRKSHSTQNDVPEQLHLPPETVGLNGADSLLKNVSIAKPRGGSTAFAERDVYNNPAFR